MQSHSIKIESNNITGRKVTISPCAATFTPSDGLIIEEPMPWPDGGGDIEISYLRITDDQLIEYIKKYAPGVVKELFSKETVLTHILDISIDSFEGLISEERKSIVVVNDRYYEVNQQVQFVNQDRQHLFKITHIHLGVGLKENYISLSLIAVGNEA